MPSPASDLPLPLARRLAERALAAARAPDRDALRPLIAHNLAVGLSLRQPPDRLGLRDGAEASPGGGAYRLAARMYGRAQDDWYHEGRCHIGVLTIPAALAMPGCDDLFGAVAGGFAAMMPVAAAYGRRAHEQGLRPTSLFGAIGAAAAAGVAAGLDARGLTHAIALASVTGAGHTQCMFAQSDEWRYEVLLAARAGAEAAELAARGAEGAALTFEGENGWAWTHFRDPEAADLRRVLSDRAFSPAEVSLKPYPASGVAFPAIHAAFAARLAGEDLGQAITLRVNGRILGVPGSALRPPFRTALGATLSLPALVAEALLTGTVGLASADLLPARAALAARIALSADDGLPDEAAVLEFHDSGARHASPDLGPVLFPAWAAMRAAPQALAARTEAPAPLVAELLDLLAHDRPGRAEVLDLFARLPPPQGAAP